MKNNNKILIQKINKKIYPKKINTSININNFFIF